MKVRTSAIVWGLGAAVALLALAILAVPGAAQTQCTMPLHGSAHLVTTDSPTCGNGQPGQDLIRLGAWDDGTNLVTSMQVNVPYNQYTVPTFSQVSGPTQYDIFVARDFTSPGGAGAASCFYAASNGGAAPTWMGGGPDTYTSPIYRMDSCNGGSPLCVSGSCPNVDTQVGTATHRWPYYQPAGDTNKHYCNEMDVLMPFSALMPSGPTATPTAAGTRIYYGVIQGAYAPPTLTGGLYFYPGRTQIGGTQNSPNADSIGDTPTAQYTNHVIGSAFQMLRTAPTGLAGTASGLTITLTWNAGGDNFVNKGYGFYVDELTPIAQRLNSATPANPNPQPTPVNALGAYSYSWTAPAAGTYSFHVDEANCRGESPYSNTFSITVTDPPVATLTCTVNTSPIYPNTPVQMTGSNGGISYSWTGNPYTTSWPAPGAYTVTLNSGAATPATCPVTVDPLPPPTCIPVTANVITLVPITLTAGGGDGVNYAWTAVGGSPASGTGATFSPSFAVPNVYTVQVTSDGVQFASCTITAADPLPVACVPADLTVPYVTPTTFTASDGRQPYSWSAPGADTEVGSGTSFTTSFPVGGTYVVTVTSDGNTSDCTVVVQQPCGGTVASFTSSSTEPMIGQTVAFSDTSTGDIVARLWDFGDSAQSTDPSPTHAFTSQGTYKVQLTETERGSGCTMTKTLDLAVGNPSAQSPSEADTGTGDGAVMAPTAYAGADIHKLEGEKVVLHGEANGERPDGLAFHWRLAEGPTGLQGTALGQDYTFTAPLLTAPEQPMRLVFELRVARGGAMSLPSQVVVTVGPADLRPLADAGADIEAVRGLTGTLDGSHSSDPEGKNLTYAWALLGGTPVTLSGATTKAPTFSVPTSGAGNFADFQLTVSDGRWTSVDTVRAWFTSAPLPAAGFAARQASPGSFVFTPEAKDGTLQWSFGDGSTSTDLAPSHAYAAGTYPVRLTQTDAAGVSHVYTHDVTADAAPAKSRDVAAQASPMPWILGGAVALALFTTGALLFFLRSKKA